MLGGAGEGLRQGAVTGTDRGQRRGRGEPEHAQREIERMHPGMGMGEPAGGLGEGHAGDEPLPHGGQATAGSRASSRASTSVAAQSGPSSARRSASGSQASGGCGGRGRAPPARDVEAVGVGFVLGVLPGGPEPGVIVVRVGETAVRGHGGVSPSR